MREFYKINRVEQRTCSTCDSPGSQTRCHCFVEFTVRLQPASGHLFDELSPYHPYMNYGRSKMEMELAVKQRAGEIETVYPCALVLWAEPAAASAIVFWMVRDGKEHIVGNGRSPFMAYVGILWGLLLAATVERAEGQIY